MKRKNNFIWIVILLVVVAMGVYYVGRKHNNTKQKHDKNHINSELNKSKVENKKKKLIWLTIVIVLKVLVEELFFIILKIKNIIYITKN
ncbi:hypothetical protein BN1095_550049 [Clostridioides difficile]|uniref:Uncharacterized protein n=1 Tax=Clostridioides difficile TaxID=1496 RepID=A0A069AWK2_CLODI|nr:hypothetical protein BN1095_550049 [Clostridioides difficile]